MATQYVAAAGIGAGSGRLSGRDPCISVLTLRQISLDLVSADIDLEEDVDTFAKKPPTWHTTTARKDHCNAKPSE